MPWRGKCSYRCVCIKIKMLIAIHTNILGSSSLIKKILWLRSSLPTCPEDFRSELIPPRHRNPVNYYPVWDNQEKCPQLRRETQNFLKNVTLQALNLFIGHPVFLLQSQELKLLPVSPSGKRIPTEISKKALVISRPALWQTETTKLFFACECESKQESQIQSAD